MTASTTRPAASAPPAAPPTARDRLRRLRFPLAVAAVVVVVAGLAALVSPGTGGGDLDPDSGSPDGSRAVARILEQQGVTVRRVRDPQDAAGEAGTVVVVHPELLSPSQLRLLAGRTGGLVLVQPDAVVLAELAESVQPAGTAPATVRTPACDLPQAQAGPARAGGQLYTLAAGATGTVCFPDGDRPRTGSLVATGGAGGAGAAVVVLGQAEVLTNAHLDEDANAALALRLLGTGASLTWLVPDPLQAAPDGEQSLGSLLPPWVRWVALQAVLALLLALLWRARRLGPVVREPLPVAVRSAETLLGRARLYRRARAADRAAATLRTAVLRRLAGRLAVPATAGPEAVAVRVAAATGQDPGKVREVLLGPPPADERALVRLADELDALERAVPLSAGRGSAGQGSRRPHQPQREGHR
jgi:hypothetical protein